MKTGYHQDGFYVHRHNLFNEDLLARAVEGMDAVREGRYDTGRGPCPSPWNPGDDVNMLCKIENPQLASQAVLELLKSPELGRLAAEVTGAERVQVWWVQLLYKPSTAAVSTNVGWHQDFAYWSNNWESPEGLFTAWVALSEVTEESGPMHFVPGSHRWGFTGDGDFFNQKDEEQLRYLKEKYGVAWTTQSGALPMGGVSLHHSLTFHGSGANRSGAPRRSFAVHLRTEKAVPISTSGLTQFLKDESVNPFIY